MKNYKLTFEDKKGNDLKITEIEANNLKDAKRIAKLALANSMMNDLHKVTASTI